MAAERVELSGYRVRPATVADVPALARVHVRSWHFAYQGIIAPHNLERTSYARALSRFRGYFWHGGQDLSLLHVLDGGAGVIGYVNSGLSNSREIVVSASSRAGPGGRAPGLVAARGEVYELYLDPDFHGLGGGRKLLSAGLWALSGRRLLPALVWVLADNHRARRFYEGMRGREVATGSVNVGDQVLGKVAYAWADYLPWPEWISSR